LISRTESTTDEMIVMRDLAVIARRPKLNGPVEFAA
jgi:hypothetical protein